MKLFHRIFRLRTLAYLAALVIALWSISLIWGKILRDNTPEHFTNDQEAKASLVADAQAHGLTTNDGYFNPIKVLQPRGTTNMIVTGRAMGDVTIEGDMVLVAYILAERLEKPADGTSYPLDEALVTATMDTDFCTIANRDSKGDAVKVQVRKVTCRTGTLKLGNQPTLIELHYTLSPTDLYQQYQNNVHAPLLPVLPIKIAPELLQPVPGEEVGGGR